jgi:hypothetical protein
VVTVGGLFEWRAIEGATTGPPAPLAVAQDRAGLNLDGQEAELRMRDDDVGLALAVDTMVADDPGQVLKEDELGRQGRTEQVVDVALGATTQALSGSSGGV